MKNSFSFKLIVSQLLMSTLLLSKEVATDEKYEQVAHSFEFYGIMFLLFLTALIITFFLAGLFGMYFKGVKEGRTFEDVFGFSFTRTKADKDELLDHNYDGIMELDNRMPPWLKYMFNFTISFAVVYSIIYLITGYGNLQLAEYNSELVQAEADVAAYQLKSASNINENDVKPLSDAKMISKGKESYEKLCIACHASDGGGLVGPNLTDDYWKNGGDFKSIFKTIKHGVPDKGMKSWKNELSPAQILQVASYVKSLRGTLPAKPKDKEGELFSGLE
jgi:cytochrome c oxidase cbb3-type subunit 3